MSLFSSKAKSEIEKLIEENDELKNTLHQVLHKHQNLVELENKLVDARKDFGEVKQQTEKYQSDSNTLNDEINAKNDRLRELTKEIEHLVEKKSIVESSSKENISKELESKLAEIDRLNIEHDELKYANEKLLLDSISLKNSIASAEAILESLRIEEKRINNLMEQYNQIDEAAINEKLALLKNEETKRTAAIKALDEKITLTEEIKSHLEQSLASIVGQLSDKEMLYTEYTNKRDALFEELRTKQKEFDEFDIKYKTAFEALRRIKEETSELEEKKNTLADEAKKYELIKLEIQQRIFQLRNEEDELTETLDQRQKLIEELENRKFQMEESQLTVENNFSQILLKFTDELNGYKNKLSSLRQEILDREKELNAKEKILLEKTMQVAEYGGLTKVLLKERTATEQFMKNLKEEFSELNGQVFRLKDEANRHKIIVQQLHSETSSLELKKESLEKEIKQLLTLSSENYSDLNENKQKLILEISQDTRELEELESQLETVKNELRQLRAETAQVEVKKEEQTAKISELIARENSLKHKISEQENKINPADGNN
jgi:chromosome segregation ATPase